MPVIVPFAEWRPLPEATSQPKIDPHTVIFHTAVGTLRGVERYFRDSTSIESHLMVGGPWDGADLDGVAWQWMDLGRRADANRQANAYAISIETSDNAPRFAEDLAPWSPRQLATLVRLGNWLAERFGIARHQCRTPNGGGFGWHAMWSGTPFMLPDGTSPWTPARGKVCPGAARIHQLKTIVLPAIFAGRDLEEDDMTPEQATQLDDATAAIKRIEAALFQGHAINRDHPIDNLFDAAGKTHRALIVPGTTTAEDAFNMLFSRVRNIEAQVQAITEELVGEPPPEPSA
jgi:hypothetical protein